MPRIQQLPAHLITKIAAGEVIERPASVVKELLENSVDAGSRRIEIDLEQGGSEFIRVVDDGCGIAPEDLPLALASHATSKLRTAEDLFNIVTMGFRGEALASIAGVAQVTLQSRMHHHDCGAEIYCAGGECRPVRPWNGAPGTRIEVRHLFYNVPVRKKFLKSTATELGHVCETVTRLALSQPRLHLTLRHNGKLVYEIPATANLLDRIELFFGPELRHALLELDSGPGAVRLSGYVADPAVDRGNARWQYLFVNGRWFRDRSLGHALQEAYRGLLMTGRYAVGFLYLSVPPDTVDVNVHPTKAEVRFRDNAALFSLIRSTIKTRLLKANLVPKLQTPTVTCSDPLGESRLLSDAWTQKEWPLKPGAENKPWKLAADQTVSSASLFSPRSPRCEDAEAAPAPWELIHDPLAPSRGNVPVTTPVNAEIAIQPAESTSATATATVLRPDAGTLNDPGSDLSIEPISSPHPFPPQTRLSFDWTAIPSGSALQVHHAYLVQETPEGMLVIDQHALHERILYEQLRHRIRTGKLEVQRLLIPVPIELTAEQAALVLSVSEDLASLGLEVSGFGGNTVLLSSYPTLLARRMPHELFQGVVDELLATDRLPAKEVLLDHLLATMACKAAVKAGDPLSPEEITALLQLRHLAENSHHCPHGRPTSLLFTRQELDRQFKRI